MGIWKIILEGMKEKFLNVLFHINCCYLSEVTEALDNAAEVRSDLYIMSTVDLRLWFITAFLSLSNVSLLSVEFGKQKAVNLVQTVEGSLTDGTSDCGEMRSVQFNEV